MDRLKVRIIGLPAFAQRRKASATMNEKRQKYQRGSVVWDTRTKIWYYRWKDHATGKRRAERLGTSRDIPTKAKASRLAEGYRSTANQATPRQTVSFEAAARRYMAERMPKRHTTGGGYRNNLEKYVIPRWGAIDLGAVKPLSLDDWFSCLPLAHNTKMDF